ncbi:MAG: HAD-IA family hydrolase [Thaumarchaeota archaeon]|nr:HAD-IA family hydrolase [Nitrososphaerota archaeon]
MSIGASGKALFCDVGGVLIADPWALTAKKLGKDYGLDSSKAYVRLVEYSKLLDLNRLTLFGLWRRFSGSSSTEIPYAHFRRLFLGESLVKIPEVWDSVQWLRDSAGFSVYALSNMCKTVWVSLQEKYAIRSLFDGETLSYACGMMKPDSRIFRLALKRARRSQAESTFLDDSEINVAAALSVGLMAHKASSPAATARFLRSLAGKA